MSSTRLISGLKLLHAAMRSLCQNTVNIFKVRRMGKPSTWIACACAISAIVMLTAGTADAATRTADTTGAWNATNTWAENIVPVAGDTVTINNGITVTVPAGYTAMCTSITFNAGNANNSITLNAANSSLTVSGAVTINAPTQNNRTKQIIVGTGTFSAGSLVLRGVNGTTRYTRLSISTGTATISGNITSLGTSSQIVFSGAGTLNAGGTFMSGTAGTFTRSTGTVNFNAAGAQSISPFAYTFNNVVLSNSGVKTLTNATINGNLSLSGTVTATAVGNVGGNLDVGAGTTFTVPGIAFAVAGTTSVSGTLTHNNATGAKTYTGNVTINNGGIWNETASPAINFGGDLQNDGTCSGAGVTSVGGTLTNTGSFTRGAGAITVGANFSNTNTFSASGAINVTGNFSNTAGAFTANASTITVNGSWTGGGTFNVGTSTVAFAGAGTTTINGSNTFNNFTCNTASKAIQVAQGTTQTVGGVFRIDGSAIGTKIFLASTGGAGTTWNLVLNGTYGCRYVTVQGSTASGAAFLPINPVGFQDDGDNTNWYDPSFPREMLFFDNFETSTLNAAPNKLFSNWTITGASWLTAASQVVDTLNHTSGGTKSLYSSGGTSGQGIGVWNNPAWGPATNCSAEAWFYDDMQNNKMQWLFIDNAAGDQGIGVIVQTDNDNDSGTGSTTKYRYCRYNFGGGTLYTDSYIDRTPGWHQVKWTHTSGTVELFLDGALLMTATGLSDFSDFDTGSWTWNNPNGSTSMWFDDFMVYRSQHQSRYRWYDNDSAETPTALAVENTTISRDTAAAVTRLRIQIQNDETQDFTGGYVGLQYRKGTNGTWESLGASSDWKYANGLGTDKAQVANALLTNTNIREHFVESQPSITNIILGPGQFGEWDFSIAPTANATVGATYFFKMVFTNAAGTFTREMSAYSQTPSCTLTSSTMTQWTGGTDNNWNNAANWTNGVPNATLDVIIPTSATRDCRINIANAQCKSLYVQSGRALLLDTASTGLTVQNDITVLGTITQSNATASLTLNGGTLRVDTTGRYNHGAGDLSASTATVQVINGGQYNVSGTQTISAQTVLISLGGLVNVSAGATFNIGNMDIELNGQWTSTSTANIVNISNNLVNNGSMLGSTGGIFNFTGAGMTMDGTSTTTTFYQANFAGSMTSSITNDVTVLNNLTINNGCSFTSSSGNLNVGGNWLNNGTFGNGGGTVDFNGGAAQTVQTGGSNWNILAVSNSSAGGVSFKDGFTTAQLRCVTPGATLFFKANASAADTYTVTDSNGFYISGASGNNVKLRLDGAAGSDRWVINPSTLDYLWTADYVDVADSVNMSANTIFPTNYVDSGNTINWFTADANNNGIPDTWEFVFYRSLVNNATADTDSDGLNTLLEYLLETDPTVPFGASGTIWVDSYTSYGANDGSAANPYKYLDDALAAANNKMIVMLKNGTYTLSNFTLTKDISIKGEDPLKTIIKGPTPSGSTSDTGQMLNVTQNTAFSLTNCTVELYGDEKPIISYDVNKNKNSVSFENVIFRDNDTGSKSLIAPNADAQQSTSVYMFNCLFYSNTANYAAELRGNVLYCYNNTIVNNTGGGLLVNGSGNSYLKNNIVRGNSGTQIFFAATGPLSSVTYCNVQGGFTGAGNIDSAEAYLDAANGNFRLMTGSPGINTGTTTFVSNDISGFARPTGAAFDMGAYEYQTTDTDGDGLTDAQEISAGTNASLADTDGDGYTDYYEINTSLTDPTMADTDSDLIADGDEARLGTNALLFDGQMKNASHRVDLYNESFESNTDYPVGNFSASIWGAAATYSGDIQVENVGAAAYDGAKIVTMTGDRPESSIVSFVERNDLPEWWIGVSYKIPRVKLPTNVDEAFNIGGIYFTVDQDGYFCVYNGTTEQWMSDVQQIPAGEWIRVYIHRYHAAKTADVWLSINYGAATRIFTAVPISGPELDNYIRISISSAQEFDVQFDLMVGYHYLYPPF